MVWPVLLLLVALAGTPSAGPDDPPGALGVAVAADWRYEFTDRDYGWLARAVECETGRRAGGPEGVAVAWTLLQRHYQVRDLYPTFARFITAYCQCVNPAWAPGGKLAERHWQDQPERAERVAAYRAMRVRQVSRAARWAAWTVLAGLSENPVPGSVHFLQRGFERHAARGTTEPLYVDRGRPGDGNAFFRLKATEAWTAETLTVRPWWWRRRCKDQHDGT